MLVILLQQAWACDGDVTSENWSDKGGPHLVKKYIYSWYCWGETWGSQHACFRTICRNQYIIFLFSNLFVIPMHYCTVCVLIRLSILVSCMYIADVKSYNFLFVNLIIVLIDKTFFDLRRDPHTHPRPRTMTKTWPSGAPLARWNSQQLLYFLYGVLWWSRHNFWIHYHTHR